MGLYSIVFRSDIENNDLLLGTDKFYKGFVIFLSCKIVAGAASTKNITFSIRDTTRILCLVGLVKIIYSAEILENFKPYIDQILIIVTLYFFYYNSLFRNTG